MAFCRANDSLRDTAGCLSAWISLSVTIHMVYIKLTDPVFSPTDIYATLFREPCLMAVQEYTQHLLVHQKFDVAVQEEFCNVFKLLNSRDAIAVHLRTLQRMRDQFANMKTNRFCLCCLMRMPEKVLKCGHSICDPCVAIFGERNPHQYKYSLSTCMLCGFQGYDQRFSLIPPTAGIRMLSFDGGGVRGIVPITILRYIEKKLAPFNCNLCDFFDGVFGTSTGKRLLDTTSSGLTHSQEALLLLVPFLRNGRPRTVGRNLRVWHKLYSSRAAAEEFSPRYST
jgi:hypothetical protein